MQGLLPRHGLVPSAALLFVAAACLGTPRGCDGCACRGEAVPVALVPAGPAATPAPPPPPEPASALPDFADPSWTRVTSRAGTYLVCWRPLGGRVPRNEDFTLEVWVLRAGAPVRDAFLGVSAWMPDHGHGMLRQPRPAAQDDGSFRVEGMLLHMRGHWQLFFEVLEGNVAETAECALEL